MTQLDTALNSFVNGVGFDYLNGIFGLFLLGIVLYNIINEFIL